MFEQEKKKKSSFPVGKVIAVAIVALSVLPDEMIALVIGLAVIGGIGYVGFLVAKNLLKAPHQRRNSPARRNRDVFDDCPKPFCFHRDKGEHHLRKGKEIDPWDRPDIDISKYQRRR